MKFLIWACFLLSAPAYAQPTFLDSINRRHDRITRNGLLVLSGVSAVNIVSGLIGQQRTTGSKKYFHRTNLMVGAVNLGISRVGYWSLRRKAGKQYNTSQSLKRTVTTEKLFLFNAGLDAGYIAYGLYTRERSNRFTGKKRAGLKGRGNSIILQGAFLTVFDGALYLLHQKNGNRLREKLSKVQFSSNGNEVSVIYTL